MAWHWLAYFAFVTLVVSFLILSAWFNPDAEDD